MKKKNVRTRIQMDKRISRSHWIVLVEKISYMKDAPAFEKLTQFTVFFLTCFSTLYQLMFFLTLKGATAHGGFFSLWFLTGTLNKQSR
ncbi:hypothetical protein Leryth_005587, partial [Lithospermum erythrorhizon]